MSTYVRHGGRRLALLGLVLCISVGPRPSTVDGAPVPIHAAADSVFGSTQAPSPAGAPMPALYVAPAYVLPRTVIACTQAARPIVITAATFTGAQPARGGQSIILHVSGLPPRTPLRLLIDAPRAHTSGNLVVPVRYSPPATTVFADADGHLADTRGSHDVSVTLPADTAKGSATISIVRDDGLASAITVLRSWRLPVAPGPATFAVQAVPGAMVTYLGEEAGTMLECRGTADAAGRLALAGLPAGQSLVRVQQGATVLATYHPQATGGAVTDLRPLIASGPGTLRLPRTPPHCDVQSGYVYRLMDSMSGVVSARSGSGPFGVFLAGVPATDNFTAQVTRQAADGTLDPIDPGAAVSVSLYHNGTNTLVGTATIGSPVAGSGTQASPGYTPATIQFDASILQAGTSYLEWQVGSSNQACVAAYQLTTVKNPASTVLGTVDTYFDAGTNSYQVSGVLPTRPRLRFSEPIDLSLPASTIEGANLPAEVFQNWNNEGDIGLDVKETIHTDGSWTGSLGGHARLILLNHTLLNEQLPSLSGGGPDLSHGAMLQTVPLASKSIDVSLYNELFEIPDLGLVVVVNVRFRANGSVNAAFGVPGTLNAAEFTLDPTLTFSVVGTGSIATPIGTFSAEVDGNLGLALPIVLEVPGGAQVHFGLRASVTATFSQTFLGSDTETILPLQCVGDCGAAPLTASGILLPTLSPPGSPRRIGPLQASSARPASGQAAPRAAQMLVVPVTAKPSTPPVDPEPAYAISPDGTRAVLWLQTGADGTRTLRARLGSGAARTLSAPHTSPSAPQIAWLSTTRALAVWVASPAGPSSIGQASAVQRDPLSALRAELSGQRLYSAVWDGRQWSSPSIVTAEPVMADEPALAANPATGEAALVWVRCPSTADLTGILGSCTLAGADWQAGRWQPAWAIPGSAASVNEPVVAVSPDGALGVAWLDGQPGMGRLIFATRTPQGWTPARQISGLPSAAWRDALAFDDTNRPVLAEESSDGLWTARRESSGAWRTWNMGAGSMPRLARAAHSTIAMLATQPAGDAQQGTGAPALSVLDGTRWSPFMPLALTVGDASTTALATDLRTGAAGIVAACVCRGGALPSPQEGNGSLLDAGARLYAQDVPPGSAATLGVDGITLAAAHPRAGEPSLVRVQLRNTGVTATPAGVAVGLTIVSAGLTQRLLLRTPQAVPPNGTSAVEAPVSTPDNVIEVAVTVDGRVAGHAVLGLLPAPQQVRVATGLGGTLVQWAPVAATDVAGYAIYRQVDGQRPVLQGMAHEDEATWIGPADADRRAVYLVATLDVRGRLSRAAEAVSTASPSHEAAAFLRRAGLEAQSSGTS